MIRQVAVVVPVADEQDTLEDCLRALRVAAAGLHAGGPVRTTAIVVLDGCTDRSAAVVASHPEVVTMISTARCVGAARRRGAEHALARHTGAPDELLLASTDADSRVPADWLVRLVAAADTGADLVLGTVVPDEGLPSRTERAWFARHDLHEGHAHVHGANLAIRADAYVSVGGWRPLVSGEDDDLVRRAAAAGLSTLRTAAIPVRTSTRAHGRAPQGFSSYLRELGHQVELTDLTAPAADG